jgi:hypothetical protein
MLSFKAFFRFMPVPVVDDRVDLAVMFNTARSLRLGQRKLFDLFCGSTLHF